MYVLQLIHLKDFEINREEIKNSLQIKQEIHNKKRKIKIKTYKMI